MKALSHPRWEDFEYDYEDDNPNSWLGNGETENEKNKTINVDYLDDEKVDFPTSVVEYLEDVQGVNGVAANGH